MGCIFLLLAGNSDWLQIINIDLNYGRPKGTRFRRRFQLGSSEMLPHFYTLIQNSSYLCFCHDPAGVGDWFYTEIG